MTPIRWPPEIDAIKVDRESILGRVKNTDIWIDLNTMDSETLTTLLSTDMKNVYVAWKLA
jgi:hypothetical protein